MENIEEIKNRLRAIVDDLNKINGRLIKSRGNIIQIIRSIEKYKKDIEQGKASGLSEEMRKKEEEYLQSCKNDLNETRDRIRLLRDIYTRVKKLKKLIEEEYVFEALENLNKDKKLFELYGKLLSEKRDQLDEIKSYLEKHCEEILLTYPNRLSSALEKYGLKLDEFANYPRLSICQGYIKFEIWERNRRGVLKAYDRKISELKLDIEKAAAAINKEYKRLFLGERDTNKILGELWEAYKKIIEREDAPIGSSIPITSVLKEISKNRKNFRLDEYIVDLTRLVESGPYVIEGLKIDFQHTRDTKKGIILQGDLARGYIGYVLFREEV